jgi:uncharacterized protein YndB with AHSA1/START domain
MINLEGSTVIDAPVERVWEFMSNLETMPQWTGVLKVDYKAPVGVGTMVVATAPLRMTFKITVTEWEPNHRFGMRFKLGAEFHEVITFEPVEGSKTGLSISLHGEARGLRRVFGPFFSYQARRDFSGRLDQIARAFEAHSKAEKMNEAMKAAGP